MHKLWTSVDSMGITSRRPQEASSSPQVLHRACVQKFPGRPAKRPFSTVSTAPTTTTQEITHHRQKARRLGTVLWITRAESSDVQSPPVRPRRYPHPGTASSNEVMANIIQDARSVGDCLCLGPRPERITQRKHVAVGTDAGISKQIPGAADGAARLEDREPLARTFPLQVDARHRCRTDPAPTIRTSKCSLGVAVSIAAAFVGA